MVLCMNKCLTLAFFGALSPALSHTVLWCFAFRVKWRTQISLSATNHPALSSIFRLHLLLLVDITQQAWEPCMQILQKERWSVRIFAMYEHPKTISGGNPNKMSTVMHQSSFTVLRIAKKEIILSRCGGLPLHYSLCTSPCFFNNSECQCWTI